MRKKLPVILILLFALSCSKSGQQGPLPGSDAAFSIEKVQSWFEQQNVHLQVNASAPTRYHNIPKWSEAVFERGANHVGYWKIPLTSKETLFRQLSIYNKNKKEDQVTLRKPWLLVYQDSAKHTSMLVMQSIPHRSETVAGGGFSGEVKFYDWNGSLQYGFTYRNGKKQQRISPAGKRDPNARWETVCRTVTDCEFQAQCTGYASSVGAIVYVAFAQTRNEDGGCSAPWESPYASTWSYYPGASWNCNGWQQTMVHQTQLCEEVWVEDVPDPEPEPEIIVPSSDYATFYQIISQLEDPCLKAMFSKLNNGRWANPLSQLVINTFAGHNSLNLRFYEVTHLPDSVDGTTTHTSSTGGGITTINMDISLNLNTLPYAAQEFTIATMLHEALHGVFQAKGMIGELDHDTMAASYVSQMAAALKEIFPNILDTHASALAWGGLHETQAWGRYKRDYPGAADAYLDLNLDYKFGRKGTNCLP